MRIGGINLLNVWNDVYVFVLFVELHYRESS